MVARFYGLKWYEIEEMPVKTYVMYERAMENIIGQETLRAIEVAIFPNLKVSAQKEIRKQYRQMAGLNQGTGKRFEDAFKEIKQWQMKK